MVYYNLACALSMLNKTDDAFSQLELSIQKDLISMRIFNMIQIWKI